MFTNEEIRSLSQPSTYHTLAAIALDWLLITTAFTLAVLFPYPVVWILCFGLIARQQLALAILMHDGAHRRLLRSFAWNDYVCQFFCAAPLFFSMYSYQKLHLKHHRDPLATDDPDLSLIGGYPIARRSFLRKIARDAFGISYLKFIRYFIHMARKPAATKNAIPEREGGHTVLKSQSSGNRISLPMLIFSMLLLNSLIWGALAWTGHGWYYLGLWVLPAVTALQVLLRIRGIAEHAGYAPGEDQRLNARTIINPVQTFIFAPHNVNYHIEHHIYPAVPFHNLPKLHRLFHERGHLPEKNVYRGYMQILKEIVR